MRAVALLGLWAVLQTGPPPPEVSASAFDLTALRYKRALQATHAGLNCAVVDPAIFAHATGSLRDLRLLRGDGQEVPFVLTLSGTTEEDTVPVLALQEHGADVSFDLPMPARAYTDVVLNLATAKDFIARVDVTAPSTVGPAASLGHYAVWNLRQEGLGRSTIVHLQELHAPLLHVELHPVAGSVRPVEVHGATVPPTRDTETLFTPAVRSTAIRQQGGTTVADLSLAPHVPIERLRVVLGPGAGNFRREVRVEARPEGTGDAEIITGEIDRLHVVREGLALDEDRLLLPATLGANLQGPAQVRVTISNGATAALPIRAVELETRERQLCFDAATRGEPLALFYGDPHLHAPASADFTRQFAMERRAAPALLEREEPNPAYQGEQHDLTLRERHPGLVYAVLLLAGCLLLGAMLRAERRGV